MSYDPNVPNELKQIQTWFAAVITQPIDQKSHICSGKAIEDEAQKYLLSSPTLKPIERIEIYNQQYWWRLLNTLHTIFPLSTRLLGYQKFNDTVATPYLNKCPSHHYSLSHLSDRLLEWMTNDYIGDDKELLMDAIAIDKAFNDSFFASQLPPITQGCSPEEAFAIKAKLQPHVFLFKMGYDLFKFRSEIKQEDPDFWSSHHFPSLHHALSEQDGHFPKLERDGPYFFVVNRSLHNRVMWQKITEPHYQLLRLLQKGCSIENACVWLETEGSSYLQESRSHLKDWIAEWIAKQWLTEMEPCLN